MTDNIGDKLIMKLSEVRIQNYRCIIDSGWFKIEDKKTILVGKNEAGKTVILRALLHLNRDKNITFTDDDYPSQFPYTEEHSQDNKPIVSAKFKLERNETELLSGLGESGFAVTDRIEFVIKVSQDMAIDRNIISFDNVNTKESPVDFDDNLNTIYEDIFSNLQSLYQEFAVYLQFEESESVEELEAEYEQLITETEDAGYLPSIALIKDTLDGYKDSVLINESNKSQIVEINNGIQEIERLCNIIQRFLDIEKELLDSVPRFVYFNKYYQIPSQTYLDKLIEKKNDEFANKESDLGILNLIKILGCTVEELSQLEGSMSAGNRDTNAENINKRRRKLITGSRELTRKINEAWHPDENSFEARFLKVEADGQLLTFDVSEDNDRWVKFNERSNGYQWLVSFYITLVSEANGAYKDAIFLLDEPALSLHGLKQVRFRDTLSCLASRNQIIYTTHSPFLVDPHELGIVRVVELDKEEGTKVDDKLGNRDPQSIYPLQAALGYNLASSLFSQKRNFVVEGFTDLRYIQTTTDMLYNSNQVELNDMVTIIPAKSASLVPIYAVILAKNDLKVGVLLDSDNEGDRQVERSDLTEVIGDKNILRVKQFLNNSKIKAAEVEDMLRDTLAQIASEKYRNGDLVDIIERRSTQSIVAILKKEIGSRFRKSDLVRSYAQWTRKEGAELTDDEIKQWTKLIKKINGILK